MNGGLTYLDLEILKAKARAFDEAVAYLEGRCDSEKLMRIRSILQVQEISQQRSEK